MWVPMVYRRCTHLLVKRLRRSRTVRPASGGDCRRTAMLRGAQTMIEITEKEIRDEMGGGPSGNFPVPADPETAAFTAETRASSLAPAGGTAMSVAVPENSRALSTPPAAMTIPTRSAFTFLGIKPDLKDMTLDEKFACLKQAVAYGQAMTGIAIKVFESIIAEFKTYKKNRPADCPTV